MWVLLILPTTTFRGTLPLSWCWAWIVQMVLIKAFYQVRGMDMGSRFPGVLFRNIVLPINEIVQYQSSLV